MTDWSETIDRGESSSEVDESAECWGLVIAWSAEEPERAGEVAPVPGGSPGSFPYLRPRRTGALRPPRAPALRSGARPSGPDAASAFEPVPLARPAPRPGAARRVD